MEFVKSIAKMQKISDSLRVEGKTIGFVPTMGFLHAGHLSLIDAARGKCDAAIVSIYVNPTQFAPNEDFRQYPRDLEADLGLCRQHKVDYVFAPSDKGIYPNGPEATIKPGEIAADLEGKSRPGHFAGVATVVARLFDAVMPNIAFFGQKDFQQALVVKQMVKNMGLNLHVEVCPIVREKDGLAMSSRNTYLSSKERKAALVLYKAIQLAKEMAAKGERKAATIEEKLRALVSAEKRAKIDYIAIRDSNTLKRISEIENGNAILLLAVWIGKTRLIDNGFLQAGK